MESMAKVPKDVPASPRPIPTSASVRDFLTAPKMHNGGPVAADGIYSLKKGEHVLTESEAKMARKHALMASGIKSLAKEGPKTKGQPSAQDSKLHAAGDHSSTKDISVRPEKNQGGAGIPQDASKSGESGHGHGENKSLDSSHAAAGSHSSTSTVRGRAEGAHSSATQQMDSKAAEAGHGHGENKAHDSAVSKTRKVSVGLRVRPKNSPKHLPDEMD